MRLEEPCQRTTACVAGHIKLPKAFDINRHQPSLLRKTPPPPLSSKFPLIHQSLSSATAMNCRMSRKGKEKARTVRFDGDDERAAKDEANYRNALHGFGLDDHGIDQIIELIQMYRAQSRELDSVFNSPPLSLLGNLYQTFSMIRQWRIIQNDLESTKHFDDICKKFDSMKEELQQFYYTCLLVYEFFPMIKEKEPAGHFQDSVPLPPHMPPQYPEVSVNTSTTQLTWGGILLVRCPEEESFMLANIPEKPGEIHDAFVALIYSLPTPLPSRLRHFSNLRFLTLVNTNLGQTPDPLHNLRLEKLKLVRPCWRDIEDARRFISAFRQVHTLIVCDVEPSSSKKPSQARTPAKVKHLALWDCPGYEEALNSVVKEAFIMKAPPKVIDQQEVRHKYTQNRPQHLPDILGKLHHEFDRMGTL